MNKKINKYTKKKTYISPLIGKKYGDLFKWFVQSYYPRLSKKFLALGNEYILSLNNLSKNKGKR
jgi:hypothetical protein